MKKHQNKKSNYLFFIPGIILVILSGCFPNESTETNKDFQNPIQTPVDVVYLIDCSKSNTNNFLEPPTQDQLNQLFDLVGSTDGMISIGRIGITRTSSAPYQTYYNCKLKKLYSSSNALYKEIIKTRKQNEVYQKEYETAKNEFVANTVAMYKFDEPFTDIVTAVKKSVTKLNNYSSAIKILIAHSDFIHDLNNRPVPFSLDIPENIQIHLVGASLQSKYNFNKSNRVFIHDNFNDLINHLKNN